MKHLLLLCLALPLFAIDPVGFQGFQWGTHKDSVALTVTGTGWKQENAPQTLPASAEITRYTVAQEIGGYKGRTSFYFFQDSLFQATIAFDFTELEEFDFNYNVFISVDTYYRTIRSKTLIFVGDIYALLRKKYGKKQPTFKGIDPRQIFVHTDNYIAVERWNLRYNPSEYYKRIIAQAYAQWLYPKSQITFAVNISAADKRFDYTLSFLSLNHSRRIQKKLDNIKSQGL